MQADTEGVLVAGSIYGTCNFINGDGSLAFTLTVVNASIVARISKDGIWQWVAQALSPIRSNTYSLVVSQQTIWTLIQFVGTTLTLGTSEITIPGNPNYNTSVLAQLSFSGQWLTAYRISGDITDVLADDLTVAPDGTLYVLTNSLSNSVQYYDAQGNVMLTVNNYILGSDTLYLARFVNGQWINVSQATNYSGLFQAKVRYYRDRIYLAYVYVVNTTLYDTTVRFTLTGFPTLNNILLTVLDPSLQYLKAITSSITVLNPLAPTEVLDLEVDEDEVMIGGYFGNRLTFAGTTISNNTNYSQSFLFLLDLNFNSIGVIYGSSNNTNSIQAITLHKSKIYIIGYNTDNLILNNGFEEILIPNPTSSRNLYLIEFSRQAKCYGS